MALLLLGAVGSGGYWLGTRSAAPDRDAAVAARSAASVPAQRKVLYYRNPMGLADTSPTPKKDPMGMDYVPVYEGEEESKLVSALSNAFQLAAEKGWTTVSFPAVSSGIFAVPLDICARAYLKAARAAPLRNVRLCLRDQPVIDAVLREMKR